LLPHFREYDFTPHIPLDDAASGQENAVIITIISLFLWTG
jgi:hypothetical protein